ncbi:MAG: hypothetical protein ACOC6G_00890 [Thermoproteota archaeon]
MKKILALGMVLVMVLAMGTGLAMAQGNGLGPQPLDEEDVYYAMFWNQGENDGDSVGDFWSAGWSGVDDTGEYWDTSALEITPNGKTIHDELGFFGDNLKREVIKPYVFICVGDGLYVSKGNLANYQFKEELGGAKRRAVVTTYLKLDEDGQFDWMIERADYYTRGEGKMEYFWTNLYTIWDHDEYGELPTDSPGRDLSEYEGEMPQEIYDTLVELVEAGPANVGGQRP